MGLEAGLGVVGQVAILGAFILGALGLHATIDASGIDDRWYWPALLFGITGSCAVAVMV